MKKGLELTKRFADKICQTETLKIGPELTKRFQPINFSVSIHENEVRVNKTFCRQEIFCLKIEL